MDIWNKSPTKKLLAEVVHNHVKGVTVLGIDTGPTGTGKTTAASEFFRDLNKFLAEEAAGVDDLKVVIVASQHRHLGHYWKAGHYQAAIRFLGALEYARRTRELAQGREPSKSLVGDMEKDGIIPDQCPLKQNMEWLDEFAAVAHRIVPAPALGDFRAVCRKHLRHRLATTSSEVLFYPCNHMCPIAGGTFFSKEGGDEVAISGCDPVAQRLKTPRIALITAAKLRYRAACFEENDGVVFERPVDFQEIQNAVFVFEEANDVFESALSYVDEMSASVEYLSAASEISEFFRRRQDLDSFQKRAYQRSTSIYLIDPTSPVVENDDWLPVNIYMPPTKMKSGYPAHGFLISVSRDRTSVVIADAPAFELTRTGGVGGAPASYRLDVGEKARGSLSLVVRSIFRKTIASFVRHFEHFHARPGAFINTRRVAQEVYETTQMHSAMARELIDLAASALDSRPVGRGERQLSWPVDDNYLGRFVT